MYRLALLCGVACLAALLGTELLFKSVIPKGIAQVCWLVLVTGLAAWCAYREPKLGWQAGAAIIVVQWFGAVALWLVTGEIFHPSSSTGGLVAVFLSGFFMALVSPLPMVAAELASRVRRRHDRRAQPPSGVAL